MIKQKSTITLVFVTIMGIAMILPASSLIQVQAVTEDDGWIKDPNDGQTFEEEKEQAEKEWEDAGRPGDDDDSGNGNGNDDDGPNPYCDQVPDNYHGGCHDRQDYYQGGPKNGLYPCNDGTDKADWRDCKDATKNNNDNDKDLPRCEYKVVQDCVLNDLGQTCEVGTSEDACQDIFYGYDSKDYKPGDKIGKKNNDNGGSNSDDIPGCQNGVIQKCVIKEIGLICNLEDRYAPINPNVVGGGHACQDIYAGISGFYDATIM